MKKGQQEMVGFVLIVVVTVVILMVFLIINLKTSENPQKSLKSTELLGAILKTTSSCAINFEPNYYNFGDLFRACKKGQVCTNQKNSCDVLESELKDLLEEAVKTESKIQFFQLDFAVVPQNGRPTIIKTIKNGDCNENFESSIQNIFLGGEKLSVRLKLC